MKHLSNYLTHLDLDLQKALVAKKAVDKLVEARTRVCDDARRDFNKAHEELRDASILQADINQRIGELKSERFVFDEEWDEWKHHH